MDGDDARPEEGHAEAPGGAREVWRVDEDLRVQGLEEVVPQHRRRRLQEPGNAGEADGDSGIGPRRNCGGRHSEQPPHAPPAGHGIRPRAGG